MKKLLVLVTILATASMAQGFTFGLAESAPQVDLGADIQVTVDITMTLDGAPDLDTVTALGIGTNTAPGAPIVVSYANNVAGWASWVLPPTPGTPIGTSDTANGAAYDSAWVAGGFDVGGFGGNIVADGVIGTLVVDIPKAALPLTLDVFAADATDLAFMWYQSPPNGGSLVITPEPGTALLLLVGALGLIRRR